MCNQIINLQETCLKKEQINSLKLILRLVKSSITKMEKRHFELNDISQNHFDVYIRMEAEEYLDKQNKMIKIGYELLVRIFNTLEDIQNQDCVNQELLEQYFEEVDLLNFMDFEVTKVYFSFLHTHSKVEMKNTNFAVVAA